MGSMPARIIALCIALSFLLAPFAPVAYAQDASSTNDAIQDQIDQTAQQINALKNEIEQLTIQLNNTTNQKQTLQTAVSQLDLSIRKLQTQISLTNAQITQTDRQIGVLGTGIATTSDSIGQAQDEIGAALRNLAELDEEPFTEALLGGGTLSSFFDQLVALGAVRDDLQSRIHTLSSLKSNLQTSKTTAQQSRDRLAALKAQLNTQKQSLALARQSQNDLLIQTKNQESSYQALIAQKKAQEAQFEADIFRLSEQLKSADTTTVPSQAHSILSWPLDSIRITQLFGKTSDSVRLYTSGSHNGVDFAASIGTPVHAALGGTIMATNYITAAQDKRIGYCQYGSWVLIKHPNGLATLYAHLSQVNVSKGQTVSTGQLIGYSGDTGYATGPHLHLTLYNASSITFKNYTCQSGYKVYIPITPVNGYLDPMAYLPGL